MSAVSYGRFSAEVQEIYALKAPATLCKMRQVLHEFAQVEGVKKTSDLKPVTIARWIKAHPDRSPATLDSLLRSFKSACTIGLASGYLRVSPFAVKVIIPGHGRPVPKIRHHSIEAINRVLKLAAEEADAGGWKEARLKALFDVYAFAALRKLEALHLHRDDVDFAKGVLRVGARRKLKTEASAAAVPMAPQLRQSLREWLPRARCDWVFPGVTRKGPWTHGPMGQRPLDSIKALGKRAGVPNLTILSLRHSFATHSAAWGISAEMRQRILRHTTLRTSSWYMHEDIDDLVAAISLVKYGANGSLSNDSIPSAS